MDSFLFTLNAILPIILLILLGYILKKINFFNDSFLKTANKFMFKIALPCLLFNNIYKINSFNNIRWNIVLFACWGIILLFILGTFITLFFVKDNTKRGVIIQCAFRSNFSILGIPLAASIGNIEAVQVAALLSAFSIPLFNILAIVVLQYFTNKDESTKGNNKINWKDMLLKIVKNPLIIGVFTGIVFLVGREVFVKLNINFSFEKSPYTGFLYKTIADVGKIASPIALIVLGGQFKFSSLKLNIKEVILGTSFRVVFAPMIILGIAIIIYKNNNFIGLNTTDFAALIGLFATPVAVSSAVMAQEMKADEMLAGQLVVSTSVSSIFTMFIIILMFSWMNLI